MAMPTDLLPFLAHNIRLDDGTLTKPDFHVDMSRYVLFESAKRALAKIYPEGVRGKRIVDLGCLEGGYAVEFARLGMDSVGIEVRQSNFDRCMYVASKVSLPNLKFVQDDVLNIKKCGRFDVVFCCGLLYHLDKPREYLKTLSEVCDRVLILDTHYATIEDAPKYKSKLSALDTHEGMVGRWYTEYDIHELTALDEKREASWENRLSFWLTKPELFNALFGAGFSSVTDEFCPRPARNDDQRAMVVAVK